MRLKKLTLGGFKSFADKAEFSFDKNIVSLVGPNGSGKSNVVEALRFVLGEQSAKSLRGGNISDLIFKGENSSMSRARVDMVFDNRDRVFKLSIGGGRKINLDFDEIKISREVYADGKNSYMINNDPVRLKDIVELVSSVNIGVTGHHIISQGQADKFLNASPTSRKIMIEESLGLKSYQYRISESEKRLENSLKNLEEIEARKRELRPELNRLKAVIEKMERAEKVKSDIVNTVAEYLDLEEFYISAMSDFLHKKRLDKELLAKDIVNKIEKARQGGGDGEKKAHIAEKRKALEEKRREMSDIVSSINNLSREIGREEGMKNFLTDTLLKAENARNDKSDEEAIKVNIGEAKTVNEEIKNAMASGSLEGAMTALASAGKFFDRILSAENKEDDVKNIADIEKRLSEVSRSLEGKERILRSKISERDVIAQEIKSLEMDIAELGNQNSKKEKLILNLSAMLGEVNSEMVAIKKELEYISMRRSDMKSVLNEIKLLIPSLEAKLAEIKKRTFSSEYPNVSESEKEITDRISNLRKDIERKKILLESLQFSGDGDIVGEYKKAEEKYSFLEKESADIKSSIDDLKHIINELKKKLEFDFLNGVKTINDKFSEFFGVMFGGGSATLQIVELGKRDDEEKKTGVDIKIKIPGKKISSLQMLSGGERSLTSISLLFALSFITPPPFLVLDETDAALDEANSVKYGDMIERLASNTQLITVTHNRETMSRSDMLYGITMDGSGRSKVLVIDLEKAVELAK